MAKQNLSSEKRLVEGMYPKPRFVKELLKEAQGASSKVWEERGASARASGKIEEAALCYFRAGLLRENGFHFASREDRVDAEDKLVGSFGKGIDLFATLPSRRDDLLQILDYFGQKYGDGIAVAAEICRSTYAKLGIPAKAEQFKRRLGKIFSFEEHGKAVLKSLGLEDMEE